jgi:penicillin amidase
MTALIVAALFAAPSISITRDSYGVPYVKAATWAEAFQAMGRVAAEDRLWQMEMSRRVSRGRLAEVVGSSAVASDKEVLKFAYTDDELNGMITKLAPRVQEAYTAYAVGVNETIEARRTAGTLPKGYADNGFAPEPWTPIDSAAIAVRLIRQFGTGGAGELRNTALLMYLDGQKVKEQKLDVMDDLAWQLDKDSTPTVSAADDPLAKTHPKFFNPTRSDTEKHLASLPKPGLFELIPALRMVEDTDSDTIAANLGVPYKMGSYALVVGPERSRTGVPLLLTAPQMGHSAPSVVHEISIDCPEYRVAGIDVPGVPAVVIGNTPTLAWGLTSGVADIEDIFVTPIDQAKITTETFTRKVKGGADFTVVQERTQLGFVALKSVAAKAVYSRHSTLHFNELRSAASVLDASQARNADEIDRAMDINAASFNLFYAFTNGDFGWRYCGQVPVRADGLDPRLPTADEPQNRWKGVLRPEQMPHVRNPKAGLIGNWNNKPAEWWPNFDTPVWGSIFRNQVLLDTLPSGKLGRRDLEMAAWSIARRETNSNAAFQPMFAAALKGDNSPAALQLSNWDGWSVDGSIGAAIYDVAVQELRKEMFEPQIGNLLDPSLFAQAVQPSLMMKALQGKTKFDWLAGRSADDHLRAAFAAAVATLSKNGDVSLWAYRPGGIGVPGQKPIPYSNRGTYIQITELLRTPVARSVASPGIAEEGEHAADQADLARAWTFKQMRGW